MAIKPNQKIGTPIYTNGWISTNKLRHKRYSWSILIPRALAEREINAKRYNLSNLVFNLELYISSANKVVSAKGGPYNNHLKWPIQNEHVI